MDREPLTVRPDDLVADIADDIKDIHYRAAVAVDERPPADRARDPLGPGQPAAASRAARRPRRAGPERAAASSRPRSSRSSTTTTSARSRRASRSRATFDPVGSTATLVIERFRQNGMEPSRPTAMMLAGAVLSDTVILNSPTTTERDHAAIDYLERVLAFDAAAFGREMFEADLRHLPDVRPTTSSPATPRSTRVSWRPDDLHRPGRDGRQRPARAPRRSCSTRCDAARERKGHALYALMVTDILAKGTRLLVSRQPAARSSGRSRSRNATARSTCRA